MSLLVAIATQISAVIQKPWWVGTSSVECGRIPPPRSTGLHVTLWKMCDSHYDWSLRGHKLWPGQICHLLQPQADPHVCNTIDCEYL
ncbi:hypothetical protein K431DRAFT_121915 [Polychaeton citri CBS 116435]|uniref:Uncharacterized protein n=1 Tax=Polychaeton citri CBS 116435 TaxID=1314669 RepID=A0A9P4UNI3_9PEZI|nr:hypothetical protein K431DRAFT_121915 [Polychaeton citri CBS 116435]